MQGGVASLIVTSGGTYGILVGNWLPLSCNLVEQQVLSKRFAEHKRGNKGQRADG